MSFEAAFGIAPPPGGWYSPENKQHREPEGKKGKFHPIDESPPGTESSSPILSRPPSRRTPDVSTIERMQMLWQREVPTRQNYVDHLRIVNELVNIARTDVRYRCLETRDVVIHEVLAINELFDDKTLCDILLGFQADGNSSLLLNSALLCEITKVGHDFRAIQRVAISIDPTLVQENLVEGLPSLWQSVHPSTYHLVRSDTSAKILDCFRVIGQEESKRTSPETA